MPPEALKKCTENTTSVKRLYPKIKNKTQPAVPTFVKHLFC